MRLRDGWSGAIGFLSPGLAGVVEFACNLWLLVYPVIMLRHLYGNSWKRTIAKAALLGVAYSTTLGLAFLATAVVLFVLL